MNDDPSEVLYDDLVLDAKVLGPSDKDWPLYVGFMPDKPEAPDNCAAIYDTEGVKDGRIMATGENIFHPGIQLRVRSKTQEEGKRKAEQLCRYLQVVKRLKVQHGATVYLVWNVSQVGPVLYLGKEEGPRQRSLHTVNFKVTISEVGMAYSKRVALTSGVAADLITFQMQDGQPKGGKIDVFVTLTDVDGKSQVYSGRVSFALVDTLGIVTGDVQVNAESPTVGASEGTLDVEADFDASSSEEVSITLTVTTSLVPVRFYVDYEPSGSY